MGTFTGPEAPPPPVGIELPQLPPPVYPSPSSDGGSTQINLSIGAAVQYAAAQSAWVQSWTKALFGGLTSALKNIFARVMALWQWVQRTWLGHIVNGIYQKLKRIFLAVQGELKRVMAIIQAYEKLVRYYEQRILMPILNVIQALRRTLVIFRIFHFRFATRLDQYLAGVEGRLARMFLFYQKELNKIIDALDLIVDPFGLFNEAMYVKSAIRSLGDLWSAIMAFPSATLSAAQDAAAVTRAGFYTSKAQHAYMKELAAGGPTPEDQAIVEAQKQSYAELGYKV